jgi:hypothetical protein
MSPVDRLRWLSRIVADACLKGSAVRVAVVFAYRQNVQTERLNPSIRTIAMESGLTERATRNGIEELERAGYVTVARSTGGNPLSTNNYCLEMPDGVNQISGMNHSAGVNHSSVTPEPQFRRPLNHSSPKQGIEQGKNKNSSKPQVTACPHSEIIKIYHEQLPELSRVVESRWQGSQRAKDLASRWREDQRHQTVEFWRWFFQCVKTNPHWLGENGRGWRADLGWLIKRANFDKVVERGVNAQQRASA